MVVASCAARRSPHYELTLENVTLNPERVSRTTWKFLVCKGRQMMETVWLSGTGLEQARITDVGRCRDPPGAHVAAKRMVPSEAVHRRRAARGRIPCQDCKRAGDCSTGYPTTRRPRELNFRKPDVVIGTRDWETVEISLLRGTGQERRTERDSQAPCPHSAARWGEVVSEPAGERDGAAVQDHLGSGGQAGSREHA